VSFTLSAPVSAHIDPDPKEGQAGSELSVGFTVEHGCDGSSTTSLDMRLPDGVTNALPEPPAGWEGSIADNVVTFTGGPLPDSEEMTFNVRMTLPATPDTTIYFPFVQRCEVGEIRWIELPTEGSSDELDEPAPAMNLIGPVVAPVVTPAPTTPGTFVDSTPAPETAGDATTTSTSFAADTTLPESSVASTSNPTESTVDSTAEEADPSADSNNVLPTVFIAGAVVLAGVGAIVVLARRRKA
jgi:periplasmic copper chaperone A